VLAAGPVAALTLCPRPPVALSPATMGICMSTNNDDVEQKKRSQAIDRKLEEDSRRLRRECKILLLGKPPPGRERVHANARQAPARAASRPSSSR
jgi:hypothetical protein